MESSGSRGSGRGVVQEAGEEGRQLDDMLICRHVHACLSVLAGCEYKDKALNLEEVY